MNFVDMLDQIRTLASGIKSQFGDLFAVDELVNEAWIKSLNNTHADAPLIMRAAKLDMIDYIRTVIGRKRFNENENNEYDKRCKNRYHKTGQPQIMTNFERETDDDFCHTNSIFDGEVYDKGYMDIENKELIRVILDSTTARLAESMVHYYLKEQTIDATGALMGVKKSRMSIILKQARKNCFNKILTMNLEYVEI